MNSNELICFVCRKYFPLLQVQNHVNKCKVIFETQNKKHLIMPEEYGIIFNALKVGMPPDTEELENFNRMIDEQSVEFGKSIATDAEFREMNKEFTETIKKSKEKTTQLRRPGERPRGLICPLCGKNFGTMSLNIVYILLLHLAYENL